MLLANKLPNTIFTKALFILASIFVLCLLVAPWSKVQAETCVPSETGAATCLDENGQVIPPSGGGEAQGTDMGANFGFWIAQIIYVFTVGFGSVVLSMAAFILNTAVTISLDSAVYGLNFISSGWTMLRDIANMAFIFILVFTALKVMFQAHTAGTMERLIKVILVALVINFSFFATRVVIDAGNLVSIQFYNVIVSDIPTTGGYGALNTPDGSYQVALKAPDLTAKIMSGINFASTFKPENFASSFTGGDIIKNFVTSLVTFSFLYIILGAAMFILAAGFIAAAVKFITRIVMLWVSIVSSPIALVMWSFQGGHGHGGGGGHSSGFSFQSWRDSLISHAFYPALFLFILLLISQFMSGEGIAGLGQSDLVGSFQGSASLGSIIVPLANIIVRLTFVLVMLYYALKASDYFKVVGGSIAKTWGNNIGFGLPAWLGRATVGGTSRFIANRTEQGSALNRVTSSLASKSFDIRGARVPYLRQTAQRLGVELPQKSVIQRTSEKFGFGKPSGIGGFDAGVAKSAKADAAAIEHHMEGPLQAAVIQAQLVREFGGPEGVASKLSQLNTEVRKLREQEKALNGKNTEKMTKAEKRAHEDSIKTIKSIIEKREGNISDLSGGYGKRIVTERNAHHKSEIVATLSRSTSIRKQLTARRLGMSKDEKKEEKEAEKEHAEHEKHDSGAKDTKGGAAHH